MREGKGMGREWGGEEEDENGNARKNSPKCKKFGILGRPLGLHLVSYIL